MDKEKELELQMERELKLCTPIENGKMLLMTHLMMCDEHHKWCYVQCVWDKEQHKHIYNKCFSVQMLALMGHVLIMKGDAKPWQPKSVIVQANSRLR